MLLRQFHQGNNLPTYIKENKDFPSQKPRQLPSAEANFEGWESESEVSVWLAVINCTPYRRNNCQENDF